MSYRLKQWFHYIHFKYATGILSSAPVACVPESKCAIHTMLSAKDVPLYLAAIKSFLRFYPSVAVVIHSDGTLRTQDEMCLRRHVPGCKLISASEADARARSLLGVDSFLWKCRGWDASYRRVIDSELWSSTRKRIIMDSDILVLRSPDEVIDWIENGHTPLLFGQPEAAQIGAVPGPAKKHIQTIFREKVDGIGRRLGLPDYFPQGATGGFYGCTADELSLKEIERLVRASVDLGVPMHEWGGEQCLVIYLLACRGALRLPPDRYFNFSAGLVNGLADARVVHFLGFCRFYKNLYVKLTIQMLRQLWANEPNPVPSVS